MLRTIALQLALVACSGALLVTTCVFELDEVVTPDAASSRDAAGGAGTTSGSGAGAVGGAGGAGDEVLLGLDCTGTVARLAVAEGDAYALCLLSGWAQSLVGPLVRGPLGGGSGTEILAEVGGLAQVGSALYAVNRCGVHALGASGPNLAVGKLGATVSAAAGAGSTVVYTELNAAFAADVLGTCITDCEPGCAAELPTVPSRAMDMVEHDGTLFVLHVPVDTLHLDACPYQGMDAGSCVELLVTTETVASGYPLGLVAVDDYVYFAVGTNVLRCPAEPVACDPEVFASGTLAVAPVATDGTYVYWVSGLDSIRRKDPAGGSQQSIRDGAMVEVITAMYAMPGAVLWGTMTGAVYRTPVPP